MPTGGSYPELRALLQRGETLILTIDLPGDVEVELGRWPARVRSGIARLALETGSIVLPVATLRRGAGLVGLIGEPIDPRGFDDAAELTRYIAAALGPVYRDAPEQVHAHLMRHLSGR